MPKYYDSIPPSLSDWALSQPLFYVASAPLSSETHINISPKGLPSLTLSVLSPNLIAYLDATGSGAETIAHIYENGRVTLMFASFGASPRIMRWFCRGEVIEWDDGRYKGLLEQMGRRREEVVSVRAVVLLRVYTCQTSCGFGVPLLPSSSPSSHNGQSKVKDEESEERPAAEPTYSDRPTLFQWGEKRAAQGDLIPYQVVNNVRSLDGLPGLKAARREKGEWLVLGDVLARARRVLVGQREAFVWGLLVAVVLEGLVRGLYGRVSSSQ